MVPGRALLLGTDVVDTFIIQDVVIETVSVANVIAPLLVAIVVGILACIRFVSLEELLARHGRFSEFPRVWSGESR